MELAQTQDHILLNRWQQARDAEAFRALSERYASLVYAAAHRVLRNSTDAEDVSQECFITLAGTKKPPQRNLGAWLHTVAVNRAKNQIRKASRRRTREEAHAIDQPVSTEIDWDDTLLHVDEAIAALDEELRPIIVAHFLEAKSQGEIADLVGVSRQTVNARVKRGVEVIRDSLAKKGITTSAAGMTAVLGAQMVEAAPTTLVATLGKVALSGAASAGGGGAFTVSMGFFGGKTAMGGGVVLAAILFLVMRSLVNGPQDIPMAPISELSALQPSGVEISRRGNVDQAGGRPIGAIVSTAASKDGSVHTAGTATAPTDPVLPPDGDPFASSNSGLGKISGHVYDADTGAPLENVHVRLVIDSPKRKTPFQALREKQKSIQSRTGRDGRYAFEDLPAGRYRIMRDFSSRLPMAREEEDLHCFVKEAQAMDGLDIKVALGIPLSGRVVDAESNPVAGARVDARDRDDSSSLEIATTDNLGRFTIYGIKKTHRLTLQATEGTRQEKGLRISEQLGPLPLGKEGLSDVVLTLHPTGGLSGVLVDSGGQPLVNVQVHVGWPMSDNRPLLGYAAEKTDGQGRFEVAGIQGGLHTILLLREGRNTYEYPVPPDNEIHLEVGQYVSGMRLVLEGADGVTISGKILSEAGKPIANASVYGRGPGGNVSAMSDWRGRYSVETDVSGEYRLHAKHKEFAKSMISDVADGSTGVDIVLGARGAISGRVVDAETGAPVQQFEVLHLDGDNRNQVGVRDRFSQMSGVDGTFLLNLVEPGPATVMARAPGYGKASVDVGMVGSGETVGDIEIRLEAGLVLMGVVRDALGQPVPDAGIIPGPIPRSQRPETAVVTRSDAHGAFRLTDLASSLEQISVFHSDYAVATRAVSLTGDKANKTTVVLTDGGVLEGTVYLDDAPFPDARVQVYGSDGSRVGGNGDRSIRPSTDQQGKFRFEKMKPGRWTVIVSFAYGQDGAPGVVRRSHMVVEIEEGVTHTMVFSFSRSTSTLEGTITHDGVPVSTGRIELIIAGPSGEESRTSVSGADGGYLFDAVPDGQAIMRIRTPEGTMHRVEFDLLPDQVQRQDVEFMVGGCVAGEVAGLGVSELAVISVSPAGSAGVGHNIHRTELGRTQVTGDGAYRVGGLVPGQYTVFARTVPNRESGEDARIVSAEIEIQGEEAIVLDLAF